MASLQACSDQHQSAPASSSSLPPSPPLGAYLASSPPSVELQVVVGLVVTAVQQGSAPGDQCRPCHGRARSAWIRSCGLGRTTSAINVHLAAQSGEVDVEDRQQVNLAAVRPGPAADRLAVRGRPLQQAGNGGSPGLRGGAALLPLVPGRLRQVTGRGRWHGGKVAVHRVVEGRRADPGEDATERALARRRTCPVHGSRRPPRTASVSCEQPAAQSAIADGESCPAAVNAHTASASTNSSGCQRPSGERGSGTRASHPRRHGRKAPSAARTAARSSRETSIREDSSAGTVLSGGSGWIAPRHFLGCAQGGRCRPLACGSGFPVARIVEDINAVAT